MHQESAATAGRAVNVSLTLRNWLIGWHICEYEQRGSDRAQYGERLLDRLAEALQGKGISRVDARELRRYRRFYTVYPQIRESLSPELRPLLPEDDRQMGNVSKEALTEEGLEDALLDKLQEFLLELGYGFCFEARQQSIVIGDTRGFVDLVFYHRILKCHVLIELKVDKFKHEHLGQLNTYVTWYRKHVMGTGDNPPIGLLLCTKKDRALVEYALAAVNNRLFVSKYQVELPSRHELQRFLQEQRRELTGDSAEDQE